MNQYEYMYYISPLVALIGIFGMMSTPPTTDQPHKEQMECAHFISIVVWLAGCIGLLIAIMMDTKKTENTLTSNETTEKIPVALGDRMKYYEEKSREFESVPPNLPFIVRLDGRCFSKFTRKFKKLATETGSKLPYFPQFKNAMILTAHHLMHEFGASSAYTHSDEITLIFGTSILTPGITRGSFADNHGKMVRFHNDTQMCSLDDVKYGNHIFGGRVDKLLSVIASNCSTIFVGHFNKQLRNSGFDEMYFFESDLLNDLTTTKTSGIPSFDSRLIVFPKDKEYEIVNHMIWRSKGDCTRNYVAMFAETHIPHNQLHGMSTATRIEKLKEFGYDLSDNSVDYAMKHGVFMKRSVCDEANARDTIKTTFYVFKNLTYSSDLLAFLLSKNNSGHDVFVEKHQDTLQMLIYNERNYQKLFDTEDVFVRKHYPSISVCSTATYCHGSEEFEDVSMWISNLITAITNADPAFKVVRMDNHDNDNGVDVRLVLQKNVEDYYDVDTENQEQFDEQVDNTETSDTVPFVETHQI